LSPLLPCVEVEARGTARGSLVWLHGLGASGHDFEEVVPLLELPHVRCVFPHAPARPITINGGYVMPAWYDIRSLGGGEGAESEADVRESARLVEALLRREQERGIASDRIVLAGFSQGAALGLHVGLRYPRPLAGILVLSGYEVLSETRAAEAAAANQTTPLLFCHGVLDELVAVERGRAAYASCRDEGRPCVWQDFEMGHQVSLEELLLVRDWLQRRFGETPQA